MKEYIKNNKTIIICVIVFLAIIYKLLLYDLNTKTAYKIEHNYEYGFRRQEVDGFFYLTGAAKIIDPDIMVCVGKCVMDEVLGEELEISLTMRKHLFGKKYIYLQIYNFNYKGIGGYIYLDKDFNYIHEDPDNIDHNKELEEVCARHQDLIDELILRADILWDIK